MNYIDYIEQLYKLNYLLNYSLRGKMKYIYLIVVMFLVILTAGYLINKQSGISGDVVKNTEDLEIKGSDTLLQMVSSLAESYSEVEPSARISVTGGGSGVGIASLINGEIDIGDG